MEKHLLGEIAEAGKKKVSEFNKSVEAEFEKVYIERGHAELLMDLLIKEGMGGREEWVLEGGDLASLMKSAGANLDNIPFDKELISLPPLNVNKIAGQVEDNLYYSYETFLASKLGEVVISDGGFVEVYSNKWIFSWGIEGEKQLKARFYDLGSIVFPSLTIGAISMGVVALMFGETEVTRSGVVFVLLVGFASLMISGAFMLLNAFAKAFRWRKKSRSSMDYCIKNRSLVCSD